VTSNIQQMEAYSKMVADVSKSLNQFRDDNTTPDDGKDQLVEQFPDVFDVGVDSFSGTGQPQLMLKDGVDQDSALSRVRGALGDYAEGSIDSIDVTDPEVQETLIKAARGQIATSRQQLLATMVLMGLSRIVVTNGKISAKIMYDFNASTQRQLSRTAMARDYARDSAGNMQLIEDREEEVERTDKGKRTYDGTYESGKSTYKGTYDADYYTKGKYKYSQRPTMTAQSMASEVENDNFSAKASLAGQVEVNFKSDYLPLDKMATPEMMAAIQMRSKPIDHNKPQYAPGPAPARPRRRRSASRSTSRRTTGKAVNHERAVRRTAARAGGARRQPATVGRPVSRGADTRVAAGAGDAHAHPAYCQLTPGEQTACPRHGEGARYIDDPNGVVSDLSAQAQSKKPVLAAAQADANEQTRRISRDRRLRRQGLRRRSRPRRRRAITALVKSVDFPAFVGGLINNVFRVIVETSIEQMRAHGELVAAVAKSAEDYRARISARARSRLSGPALSRPCRRGCRRRRQLANSRQGGGQ
jgi:hypothetical protein